MTTARLRELLIDPDRRRVRVGAGVKWGEVQVAAARHGLAGLAGSSPDVGVVGYTLGGGLGWMARRYGLACNSVLAFDVVTADGRPLRVDHEHEPDLFWALRGGGGSFVIVTAVEFALYPVRELYAGALFWPQERAAQILPAWRSWAASVPDSVTSVGRLLNVPQVSEMPERLRGRSFVLVEAACLATEDEGVQLLRALRDHEPEIDTFGMLPPTGLGELHMDPVGPVPAFIDGWLLADLPPVAIDTFLAAVGPGSSIRRCSRSSCDNWGRSLPTRRRTTAPWHRWTPASLAPPTAWYRIRTGRSPWGATPPCCAQRWPPGKRSATTPTSRRRSFDLADLFSPAARERLSRVKAQYDPGNLILATHPVPVA